MGVPNRIESTEILLEKNKTEIYEPVFTSFRV